MVVRAMASHKRFVITQIWLFFMYEMDAAMPLLLQSHLKNTA
jgi:hypothetical protein